MADPHDLLRHGDLDGARSALVEIVRSKPQDAQARMFLFQLLALLGEWDKARLQLTTLATLSPEAQMLSAAYGQAIEAERHRALAFSGDADIPVHGADEGWPLQLAQALTCFARGDAVRGNELREAAFDAARDTPGTANGIAFDWIANADSRFGPSLEAIIGGKWGIVPFSVIERIESAGVRDLRDLMWYPVQIAFRSGQSAAAMLPGRYPGTETAGTGPEKLARATNWSAGAAGDQGTGQQLLALSGGEDIGLLEIRTLVFE
ncbi:type VI secretion system accessory protein TagJ [Novosphingobium sp.]|uniref:type VI secretion system accessory protein TagJ n=1 Tax=Novosphingobium sp. TaxID=1874826 RepID=UPI0027372E40|nr:type VI secretion system accessory protein TagJ [Novosphingobium sp.]MDP3908213.1 type VI secretion system accessory protein TagJ [Novosphingobium sp.]